MRLLFTDSKLVEKHAAELEAMTGVSAADLPLSHRSGVPVLLDDAMQPIEPWCTYLRLLAQTVAPSTMRDYGYDARSFAQFLEGRSVDVLSAQQDDLLAYRDFKMTVSERPVSPATWHRNVVVVRGIFAFLIRAGLRDTEPWIRVGSRTVLDVPIHQEMVVRALSQDQWFSFRDIGLGGQLPNGDLDGSWRGQHPVRSRAAAEVALTTGMRLAEWRTLLNCELPPMADTDGASVVLQACAKYQKRRRVFVPRSALKEIDLYRRTERRRVVRASHAALWKRRHELAVVRGIDRAKGKISFEIDGQSKVMAIEDIPPHLRRIMVVDGDGGLESLSLFVGRGGLPPGHRNWLRTFELANIRIASFTDQLPGMPVAITPHDLRHTFAVVLLRSLMDVAFQRETSRRDGGGHGSLSEHIAVNPLLTLQRLLGHSSPATTMVYLRHVEDTDALVQRCFESWMLDDRDYADHILTEQMRIADAG